MAVSNTTPSIPDSRAFTLIEVIMAVAISGMVMAAVASFLYSTAQAYARETYLNTRDEHIQGVSSFLRQIILESQASEEKLAWSALPDETNKDPEYLKFQLIQPNPLLTYGKISPSGVVCYLKVTEPDDFILLWRPKLMPEDNPDKPALFKLTITDQISEISYFYFDEEMERWEEDSQPEKGDNGQYLMPEFIELTFKDNDGEAGKSIRIALPSADSHPLVL